MKNFVKFTILGAALFAAAPAYATEYISNVQLASGGKYTVSVNGETVYDDALVGTVNGKQVLFNCDDIYHNISLGQSGNFDSSIFTGSTNFNGGNYTAVQTNSLAWFVEESTKLWQSNDSNLSLDLASLQLASWIVGNPTANITNYDSNVFTTAQNYIVESNSSVAGKVYQLTSQDGLQSQIAVDAVPESATWMVFILGLGFIGFTMRKDSSVILNA